MCRYVRWYEVPVYSVEKMSASILGECAYSAVIHYYSLYMYMRIVQWYTIYFRSIYVRVV
jgi:hypothetical protein